MLSTSCSAASLSVTSLSPSVRIEEYNKMDFNGERVDSNQEYSLSVALHVVLREIVHNRGWYYYVYRRYDVLCEGGKYCHGSNDKVQDLWTDKGHVIVKGVNFRIPKFKRKRLTKYYTLHTDFSDNPIDIAKYYFLMAGLNTEELCSGAFVLYTTSTQNSIGERFLIQDSSEASELFNNGGLMLRIAKLTKELEDELALILNRYLLEIILDEINIRHLGKVNDTLRALMMSQCASTSYSSSKYANFIGEHVPVTDLQEIVIHVINECCEFKHNFQAWDFVTLDGLPKFISSFRVAYNQSQLKEIQSRSQALLRELPSKNSKENVPEVYKRIMRILVRWYKSRHFHCQGNYHEWMNLAAAIDFKSGWFVDWKKVYNLI